MLSEDKYNEMWDAYRDRQTVASVAEKCQVARATARKYIHRGDPNRNLEALAPRYQRWIEEVNKLADIDSAEVYAENYRQSHQLKLRVIRRMLEQLDNEDRPFTVQVKDIELLMKKEEESARRYVGEPDVVIAMLNQEKDRLFRALRLAGVDRDQVAVIRRELMSDR